MNKVVSIAFNAQAGEGWEILELESTGAATACIVQLWKLRLSHRAANFTSAASLSKKLLNQPRMEQHEAVSMRMQTIQHSAVNISIPSRQDN